MLKEYEKHLGRGFDVGEKQIIDKNIETFNQ